MKRICFYHAGCPDGFGAAWAAYQAWGDEARYVARRHEHTIDADDYRDAWVAYVDIAPGNQELLDLCRVASQVTVLDHHITARERYHSDPDVVNQIEELGHEVLYDMDHSGAVLSWLYFREGTPVPDLLRYVEDQDLWNWELAGSEAVNAAIATRPHRFDVWNELAEKPIEDLVAEGTPLVRAKRIEVERLASSAHPLLVDGKLVEAVNATNHRSAIGHALAERKAYAVEWGCVYRLSGDTVHATLYSIGDVDVGRTASLYGGGGHRNAAGFSVSLSDWLRDFIQPAG